MRAYAGKIIPGDTDIVISSKTQFYFHDMSSAMASTKFEGAEIPMVCAEAEMAGAYKKTFVGTRRCDQSSHGR